jgi:tryptophanyl-tRNA synthetase
MRHLARHFLHVLLVAAAIGVSGANAYAGVLAAFDVHAHGAHGVHSHPSHDDHGHNHGHGGGQEDHAALDHDSNGRNPASTDSQPCTHVHVHCCSSFAVQAADITLTVGIHVRTIVPVADSHIPHGELASPLFRPPRAIA